MPKAPPVDCIDFETDPIEDRPNYPPKPVGVSIIEWGKKPRIWRGDTIRARTTVHWRTQSVAQGSMEQRAAQAVSTRPSLTLM
jgi:hypothetical protein